MELFQSLEIKYGSPVLLGVLISQITDFIEYEFSSITISRFLPR